MENVLALFENITTFLLDVDGVLTNSELLVQNDGSLLRTVNIRDGYAIKVALEQGYNIVIISGGKNEGVQKRFENLGVQQVYLGIQNKAEKLAELLQTQAVDKLDKCLYMGDDMIDIECMKQVLLPCCPADACHQVKAISKYMSPLNGGQGCVRDVIEKVLTLNAKWH